MVNLSIYLASFLDKTFKNQGIAKLHEHKRDICKIVIMDSKYMFKIFEVKNN